MKTKTLLLFLLVAAAAGASGWWAARRTPVPPATTANAGRKIRFYQSAMHPWITSDRPGKCTVCGMDLVPVYEGDQGFATGAGVVSLGSNSISVLHVQTDTARRQPLHRTLRVAGVIDDNDARHRRLSAYIEGRIDKLFVDHIGAEVVEGQPLATLYSPMLLAAEREYVALVRGAANPTLQQAATQRLRQLGLTTAQIEALPLKLTDDYRTEILAPLTGTVITREVYEGQYVKEGDRLFELADFSTMWFRFDAYERDLAWIKPGQMVEVTTAAAPGRVFRAPITFIDPNLADATRSAKVRVELPNPLIEEGDRPRRELLHRLYAEGVVAVELPDVLAVPRSAVLSPGAQPVVYVDRGGGSYEPRNVKLGRAGDTLWEVLEGLADGEAVVTQGNLLIDAQAQLNRSVSAAAHEPGAALPAPTPSAGLAAVQEAAAKNFLTVADAVAAALAKDDLAAFNAQATKLHTVLGNLLTAFDAAESWHALLQPLEANGHLPPATDLTAARKSFLPFGRALVEFARRLRGQEAFRSVKLFQCPMVNTTIPGAPKLGYWLQLGTPLQNPYMGQAMIDCGTELKIP